MVELHLWSSSTNQIGPHRRASPLRPVVRHEDTLVDLLDASVTFPLDRNDLQQDNGRKAFRSLPPAAPGNGNTFCPSPIRIHLLFSSGVVFVMAAMHQPMICCLACGADIPSVMRMRFCEKCGPYFTPLQSMSLHVIVWKCVDFFTIVTGSQMDVPPRDRESAVTKWPHTQDTEIESGLSYRLRCHYHWAWEVYTANRWRMNEGYQLVREMGVDDDGVSSMLFRHQ